MRSRACLASRPSMLPSRLILVEHFEVLGRGKEVLYNTVQFNTEDRMSRCNAPSAFK